MIQTKHICDLCGANFDEDKLKEAKDHEKIQIVEGDYHGVAVKDSNEEIYLIFVKNSRELSSSHERIYNLTRMSYGDLELYSKHGITDLHYLPASMGLSVSEIKASDYEPLSKQELTDLDALHKCGYIYDFYTRQIADPLRTISSNKI